MTNDGAGGRLTFRIGDVFPSIDPLAVFLTALSAGLNDLVLTNRLMISGSAEPDDPRRNRAAERNYFLRLCMAQVHEMRESIRFARQDEKVESFLAALPADVRANLAKLMDSNQPEHPWINKAIKHVRNQTLHYGGKHNWNDEVWALNLAADEQGSIDFVDSTLGGMRASYADTIVSQQLLRKLPEYAEDDEADLPQHVIADRLATLFEAVAATVVAATDFATHALNAYLDEVPESVMEAEQDSDTATAG